MSQGLSEQILTGIVDWQNKQIWIAGKCIDIDRHDAFNINIPELTAKESPTQAFEHKMMELLNDKQRMTVYDLWGRSSSIIKNSTVNALDGDKELTKQILAVGEFFRVLSRGHHFTWKVNDKLMKDRMVMLSRKLAEELNEIKPQLTSEEQRQQIYDEYKPEKLDGKEETPFLDGEESVLSEMNTKLELPTLLQDRVMVPVESSRKKPGLVKPLAKRKKAT